ncbi:helix-turn-helix domain protein [Tolumonas auensis DSM 9187]|uniref:Helix-turn-helix domain protein n=1 Tax=Tolumonas auensis (strain DSM 9187 / NBRC 110442 / TA 4) TaxID=595494 RepID=C4LDU1_TOLAT|nr:helix-turn-helix domain-containing protein [Tolumonas auensis]ACQ94702.1 helix-turn-helix domain protein [Tolumonas auensis DSM 9187]
MRITSPQMLSQALRDARIQRKLSQQATARQTGMKQTTVSAFENHPDGTRIETLFKLLSALDLELHLAKRDSEPDKSQGWDQEW